ncbi:Endopolyphosphatase [Lecanora helva]
MLCKLVVFTLCLRLGITFPTVQKPIPSKPIDNGDQSLIVGDNSLHGKFLHITDFHPDRFYRQYASTEEEDACHRGDGPAGRLGAETTDCDSPITLINETFRWINDNLKDTIDFVIWTGDSARHDSDEQIPRTEHQVVELNELLVQKFTEVFGKEDNINDTDPTNDFAIPIIPTFGNNDIMPHNIFTPGPNFWTRKYTSIWRKFIPEEQRHSFTRGGWFWVEVIPKQLAVFSLNTLYFFDSNTAVDGCAMKSEPGYEQMEWLRIQLQFLRQRGMKAILTGHVPPARTEGKQSWDETCWQKYTLWMKQYRDIVVGSVYGHMNIDHFILQDFKQISDEALRGEADPISRIALDDELTIQSSADYLTELRSYWAQLPDPPTSASMSDLSLKFVRNVMNRIFGKKKHKKSKEDKFISKIGGEWAERYSLSLVSPSVVPNYFPTMRLVEYNISGVAEASLTGQAIEHDSRDIDGKLIDLAEQPKDLTEKERPNNKDDKSFSKKPSLVIPKSPSKSAPPGPAYSPQAFSWLGYTQYYANLTRINGDFTPNEDDLGSNRWHNGKHSGKKPKEKSKHPKKLRYEVEYNTRHDSVFDLQDLSVRSYVELASRIGQYRSHANVLHLGEETASTNTNTSCDSNGVSLQKNKKYRKHHGKKHRHRKAIEKIWFAFVNRAYVGTRDDEDLHDQFG